MRWVFTVLFRITIAGYIIWTAIAISRGVRLASIFGLIHGNGAASHLKTQLTSVSGVTTIVEVGIAAATVGSYCLFVSKDRSVRWRLAIIVLIAAIRASLNSERLALIEVVIPIAIVWLGSRVFLGQMTARLRRLLILVPLLAIMSLATYFGLTEYFRSYSYYSRVESTSIVPYTITRLEGYYITSCNNGALIERYYFPRHRVPYFTIEAFWRAPLISTVLPYRHFEGGIDALTEESSIYRTYGNPSFNDVGGLLVPLIDYGRIGGSFFMGGVGVVVGLIYGLWRRGSVAGLMFYPFILTGLFDLPRGFYWTSGRCFPALVALAWAVVAIKGESSHRLRRLLPSAILRQRST